MYQIHTLWSKFKIINRAGEVGQCLDHLPPTNVVWVQFPDPVSNASQGLVVLG